MTVKDAQITASGLLQAVVRADTPPDQWVTQATHALRVHRYLTRKLLGETCATPVYKENDDG